MNVFRVGVGGRTLKSGVPIRATEVAATRASGGDGLQVVIVLSAVILAGLVMVPTGRAADSAPNGSPASGPGPHPTAFVPFAPNLLVNTVNLGYNYQVEPTMKIDSHGKIYVGWKEALTHNGGGQRVGFAYSTNGGDTFSLNILMPLAILPRQSDPWLSVTPNDRVFFTRIEYDNTGVPGGIAVTNPTDGLTWGTTYYYDDSPNFEDKESAANDAAGNLYWVWNTDSATRQDLAFTRSNNGGATWTSKVLVSGPGTLGGVGNVAPIGAVLATWWSYATSNVMFDRSLDGGRTWGTDIRVNDIPGSAASPLGGDPPVLPSMAVAPNGTIYIAYEDYRNGRPGGIANGDMDIFFARSPDGGTTWSPGVRVNDDTTTARQWMPDLALDPFGGIHLAWEDDRTGSHNIYYANSTDGGATFGPNIRVTTVETPVTYTRPGDSLAIESAPNGTICIVWTDGRGADLDIYFARLERTFPATIDTVPTGLKVAVDGLPFTAPATFSWRPGTPHTVSAPSSQAIGPSSRHVFASWSDGGGQVHTVTAGDTAVTITATYETEHVISVRTAPVPLDLLVDGAPVVGGVMQWWTEGSTHQIGTPTPQVVSTGVRYVFISWSDGGGTNHAVSPTAPTEFLATFRPQYLLTVTSPYGSPRGSGWYNASEVAAFGVPDTVNGPTGTRHVFTSWSGDASAADPSSSVAMDGPKTVAAAWRTEHLLTIVSLYGTPEGGGWYTHGAQATVTIQDTVTVNGTAYRFAGWTGASMDPSSAVLVMMDGPKTLTAMWTVVPPSGPPPSAVIDVLPWILVLIVVAVIGGLPFFVLWRRRRKGEEKETPPPST